MRFKIIFILLSIVIITTEFAFAQQTPTKTDSAAFYKSIEAYSKRSKFSKFIYGLVFRPIPINTTKKKIKKRQYKKLIQKPYSTFEGKTIRHINIETLDPFGYSITNLIAKPDDFVSKIGNDLHVKTRQITIRNLLLIHQNQKFDSLLVKESERLVRSMGYVHDVSFFVVSTAKKSDSVDIFIRVLDNWSIVPVGGASTSTFNINLTDRNFMGLGHEFQAGYTWYSSTGPAYTTYYTIPNIRNTYINTSLHYSNDRYNNFTKSFAFDRPFFSPFAKWAAGINFTQQFRKDYIQEIDTPFVMQRFKLNSQDYWAGFATQIFKGNTENKRTTNFISAVRFLRIRYIEKPEEILDTLHEFSNEYFYLASIGISTRKYVQDKYIFNYGVTEDVPIGSVYNITAGYQIRDNTSRMYAGVRFSFGNYHPWGYLSWDFEYGTFFHSSVPEQGVFTAAVIYFTGLKEMGRWKFRQFIKPQLTIGINRLSYENLTINNDNFVKGFSTSSLLGTKKIVFTLQTQSYAPWNFIGFRFGPYLICSLGMLGDDKTGFANSRIYSQFGLGVLIKNEYLIFNTFQVSIAYFPVLPGVGNNVFKLNPISSSDFGYRDFIIGKPAVIVFQ